MKMGGQGKKSRRYLWLWLLAVSVALTGCGRETKQEQTSEKTEQELLVVGFSEVGAESDWRVANTESMRNTFTEERGYELLFDDAKQKQDNQILAIRNYILQEVDYIVFAPVVESGWDEVLQESQEAGIPVIVVDRMVDVGDDSLFAAWVGSDFRREGQMAVNWLAHYLEEQGRDGEDISILHVQGTEGSSAQIGRTAGLLEGVKEHSNWHILRQVEGEFTKAKSYEVVSAVLKEREIPDVVYCENDESALGAVQALDEYGITHGPDGDVIVISFDATRAGLTACMNREINLDMECNPLHGPRVEALIRQIEAGETPNQYCYVEETWFTPEELTEERIAKREY